ncbi:MAG: YbgC/FadM family acyl-CoA thioesterase [Myxococcota bacterium]|nr:YbgC/FadM family acyl-CoA thioesterase [Myxococcota bacterium]MEC8381363.1 YbgC/FadM family acyl-CoA thioesterase [Myxococcota bacterium]
MNYRFEVQVYYEDTDHSGVVYHANYLKYFERAREDMLGISELVDLWNNQQIGFVVYKANLSYRKGAQFGEKLTILSRVQKESAYRLLFHQAAFGDNNQASYVEAEIELACVHQDKGLVPIPQAVLDRLL